MRLAIHDYSQEAATAMVDTVCVNGKEKRVAIDATDLLILDWFTKFYPFMRKRVIDGKEYGWIKRSKVIEDLPILRINEKSVSERLKKLVHFKLLDYRLVEDGGKFCYYTHGDSYPQLVYDFSTMDDGHRAVKRPTNGRSNALPMGGQTDIKDRGLDSFNKNKWNGKGGYQQFTPPKDIPCPECGGNMGYNIQMARRECHGCGFVPND